MWFIEVGLMLSVNHAVSDSVNVLMNWSSCKLLE